MSDKTEQTKNYSGGIIGVIILMLVVIGGIYLFARPEQKSNAQQFAECSTNAGKIYDSGRKTITTNTNGYSKAEQDYYYQQTSNGYTRDLENCRSLYGQ
jgi:hypothetical protein